MHKGFTRFGRAAPGIACAILALSACSKEKSTTDATTTAATAPAANDVAAAAPAAAAPAADNTDTVDGTKYASLTGDAAKGEVAFVTCKTCHAVEAGVNKIGPSLHGILGRTAGTVAGFNYTPANKNSGITWSEAKLFQYLENPQRIVPGTKMAFAGFPTDPQKRADIIAYLKTHT